ncbi:hypothetical protein AURDEDRAFT_170300 [Auricularia subglabra TFB-10046 SS5]|nr:hypothetical protein AURDEDRAFT_170300 [Auricularia subglabra TFB-10046 SS5]
MTSTQQRTPFPVSPGYKYGLSGELGLQAWLRAPDIQRIQKDASTRQLERALVFCDGHSRSTQKCQAFQFSRHRPAPTFLACDDMLPGRVPAMAAKRRALSTTKHGHATPSRRDGRVSRVPSLSQQLDEADRRASSTRSPVTPRTNRHISPSFSILPARFSSPSDNNDEEESFTRIFTRQRTPSSSHSRKSVKMCASSPEPVSPVRSPASSESHATNAQRTIAQLPARTGPFMTRKLDIHIELITSKSLDFNVAVSGTQLTWANIQSRVASLFSDGEFGLDLFDERVGKWHQCGLDGIVNLLAAQVLVRGRVVHAHAQSLDNIDIATTDFDSSPVRLNDNGKRSDFPPLKLAERSLKKFRTDTPLL